MLGMTDGLLLFGVENVAYHRETARLYDSDSHRVEGPETVLTAKMTVDVWLSCAPNPFASGSSLKLHLRVRVSSIKDKSSLEQMIRQHLANKYPDALLYTHEEYGRLQLPLTIGF